MTGIEKIIAHIQEDTAREEANVLQSAESHAARMLEEAKARCGENDRKADAECARKLELLMSTADSAAHKDGKSMLLTARRELIDRVFSDALTQLQSLRGAARYDAYARIIERSAMSGEGALILSAEDAAALPDGFVDGCNRTLQNGSIRLSDERRPTGGGLILQYGSIEINCTFEEMLSASREQLEDEVSRLLFQ